MRSFVDAGHHCARDGGRARGAGCRHRGQRHMAMTVLSALRAASFTSAFAIIAGLLFAQTGLVVPDVVDKPLHLLGSAFVGGLGAGGVTLTQVQVGPHLKSAWASAVEEPGSAMPGGALGLALACRFAVGGDDRHRLVANRPMCFVCAALRGGARPGHGSMAYRPCWGWPPSPGHVAGGLLG